MKKRLFTPGPTPIPESVMLAMAEPIIHHRNPEFEAILTSVNENLKYLFQTKNEVVTLTSSGTGAMEAAVSNLLSAGDKAIFVNLGKFGERWGEIMKAYGVEPVEIKVEWGTAPSPEIILDAIKNNPTVKAVYLTHSETSTGVFTNIKEIAKAVHDKYDIAVVVDGITSVGAHEMRFDDWGLDAIVTGSQKGLMIPPGLAFATLSDRAKKMLETSNLPKYYFSLKKALKAHAGNDTPFTPAITLVIGLEKALRMIKDETVERIWLHHRILSEAVRNGCEAIGLKLFGSPASHAVTSVYVPEGVEYSKFNKILKLKYGITTAGGQEHLKGKIFRVAHLGYYDEVDIVGVVAALEWTLHDLNFKFEPGSGVTAVQKTFAKYSREATEVAR
ncbi:MAG TPA: alanine--glyoxylate aminotransferase family protein [Candidatus Kryptonia bacterium]